MTKKSCYRGAACAPRHDQSEIAEDANQATKREQSSSPGKRTWKARCLKLLSKFPTKMKHKKPDAKQWRHPKRSSRQVLRECGDLVRVVRRAAADCFAAAVASSSAGDDDDDLQPSYMQLDQASYGVKRDAFGPIYLVT